MPLDKTASKNKKNKDEQVDLENIVEEKKETVVNKPEENVVKIDASGKELKKKKEKFAWWKKLTKKQQAMYLIFAGVGILILVGICFALFKALGLGKWGKNDPAVISNIETTEEAIVLEVPRDHELPLTGELVTKEIYDVVVVRRPLSVIVENHSDARPQSGLNEADIVWEALAEGGISRFMPVYLSKQPDKVGPVRSLRKYFLDWNAELRDGLVMHIGYAHTDNVETNALGYLYTNDVKSLGFLPNLTWRSSERLAPHNAYSSTVDLWKAAVDKGWTGVSSLDKWKFKEDGGVEVLTGVENEEDSDTEKMVELEEVQNDLVSEIRFNWFGYSTTSYSVNWTYDEVNNQYLRAHNGIPHTDADSGDQIFAKNVVIEIVPAYYTVDTDSKSRLIYNLVGEGPAHVFLDGKEITATWKKSDRVSRTKYYDEDGVEILFNRGRTWISVLPVGSDIQF